MKKIKRNLICVLALFFILFIIFIYFSNKSDRNNSINIKVKRNNIEDNKSLSQDNKEIIIGITPWTAHAPFVVAEEKGFFENLGISVKVVVFNDVTARNNAFFSGNTHFSMIECGDAILFNSINNSSSIVTEAIDFSKSDVMVILIKKNYKNLSEVKSKLVACEKGTSYMLFLERALNIYGLTTNDVNVIDMTHIEALTAFMRDRLDVVVTFKQPYLNKAINEGKGKIALTSAEIDQDFLDCICVQKNLLVSNPLMITKVLKGWFEAVKWSEENPDEFYDIALKKVFYMYHGATIDDLRLQKQFEILKPEVLKERMEYNGHIYRYTEDILNLHHKMGNLALKPDIKTLVDNKPFFEAIKSYNE